MNSSRGRLRHRSRLTVALFLAMAATGACHQRQAEPADGPDRGQSSDPAILERHEMNQSASNFVELIQGRLPGVVVRQRGTSVSVQIRGQGSIQSSNEALILIDGINTPARELSAINPRDVERVQVVKDGTAAFYGLRGANGALLITMRRRS